MEEEDPEKAKVLKEQRRCARGARTLTDRHLLAGGMSPAQLEEYKQRANMRGAG